jgi:sensor histidine kinase regulating citrate/malate metabolism
MLVTGPLLDDLRRQYIRSSIAADRTLALGPVWNGVLWTDRRLLFRILGNMLKNGLEAISPGQAVTIGCSERGDDVAFWIHNPGVMPDQVQLQMFQRSFSTKGQPGRGIGTYSMKLLGERYLGGRVEFVSRDPDGTTFTLSLPKTPD